MAYKSKRQKLVDRIDEIINRSGGYDCGDRHVHVEVSLLKESLEEICSNIKPDFSCTFINPDDYVRVGDVMDLLSEVKTSDREAMHAEGLIEWAMGKRAVGIDTLKKIIEKNSVFEGESI